MVGEDYGIRWLPTFRQSNRILSNPRPLDRYMPNLRVVPPAEHPFPVDSQIIAFDTMYAETGRLLRQLEEDVRTAGGRIVIRDFATPADVLALQETLVFNCTGLGAARLFNDPGMVPIRGQLAILIPQPEVRYAFNGRAGHMFPRPDGILLGGTFERGVELPEPQPEDIARILASHAAFYSGFRCTA
jgi:hypothetical protein